MGVFNFYLFIFKKISKDNSPETEPPSKKSTSEKKKNITKMVIITSLIFLGGNILNPITFFHGTIFNMLRGKTFVILSLISNTLLFASYGVNIFVFYAYNTNYRVAFRKLIKKKFKITCVKNF